MKQKIKKILLLVVVFDVLIVIMANIIMIKKRTINLIDNFDLAALSIFLAIFLLPSLIPAMITAKIKKDSDRKFIIKQSVFTIIILLIYYFIMNFIFAPFNHYF